MAFGLLFYLFFYLWTMATAATMSRLFQAGDRVLLFDSKARRYLVTLAAEGEFQAAQRLADAAEIMSRSPITLKLRYLQTLKEIAAEHNSTIIFPIPIDLFEPFLNLRRAATPDGGTKP